MKNNNNNIQAEQINVAIGDLRDDILERVNA